MLNYIPVNATDPEQDGIMTRNNTTVVTALQLDTKICKVYKIRWAILCMFVLYAAVSLMQWIQYSIIADVVVTYYGISYDLANWASLIYMLIYVPFLFPGSYLLQKMGLRVAVLVGLFGTTAGAWIKVVSVSPNRYWVLLLGQGVVAITQVLILPTPPRLAAIWFGPNEVSFACSIGIFGIMLGIAVGFLVPPLLVDSKSNLDDIERALEIMAYGVAAICSILFLVVLAFFKTEPPTPPSPAQLKVREDKENAIGFIKSLKYLVFHRSYMLLLIAYGICLGTFSAVSALLNQIVLAYYPNSAKDAGIIGLVIMFTGMAATLFLGILLDKFKRFRETTILVYFISLAAMIVLAFTLNQGLVVLYLICGLLGFSLIGFKTVGFELASELTYPIPEGTSGGVLTVASQSSAIALTYLYSYLFYSVSHLWANLAICAVLLLGFVMVCCIKYDLKRQAVQNMRNSPI